jgi:hypothetical protein
VRAVKDAGVGSARVTLSFPDCEDLDVGAATYEIPVVAAPPAGKK